MNRNQELQDTGAPQRMCRTVEDALEGKLFLVYFYFIKAYFYDEYTENRFEYDSILPLTPDVNTLLTLYALSVKPGQESLLGRSYPKSYPGTARSPGISSTRMSSI
jgi:hypothetical protein